MDWGTHLLDVCIHGISLGVFEWLYSVHYISFNIGLAWVVQMLDSAIHRINHYPADKY